MHPKIPATCSPKLYLIAGVSAHSAVLFFPRLRLPSLSHSAVSWKTLFCCLWMDGTGCRQMGVCFGRSLWSWVFFIYIFFLFLSKPLLFLNSVQMCVLRARTTSYFVIPSFFEGVCSWKNNKNRISHPVIVLGTASCGTPVLFCVYIVSFFLIYPHSAAAVVCLAHFLFICSHHLVEGRKIPWFPAYVCMSDGWGGGVSHLSPMISCLNSLRHMLARAHTHSVPRLMTRTWKIFAVPPTPPSDSLRDH